ncbi:hypothetical protein [Methanobrevibacter sp. DSM 116169]|uniref:hypothetical protein n=1 Tax=Methanobrevibacter sp. DSM 116169 TaxID=3242727 RepID=UPI0038FCAD28
MAFDWKDYHILADELESSNCDAKKRTSINRSYYSAYCVARDLLIDNGAYVDANNKEIINSATSKAHSEVKNTYKDLSFHCKRGDKNLGLQIFKRLNRLRDKRNMVDYQKSFSNLQFEANKCLIDSKFVLDNVENFL